MSTRLGAHKFSNNDHRETQVPSRSSSMLRWFATLVITHTVVTGTYGAEFNDKDCEAVAKVEQLTNMTFAELAAENFTAEKNCLSSAGPFDCAGRVRKRLQDYVVFFDGAGFQERKKEIAVERAVRSASLDIGIATGVLSWAEPHGDGVGGLLILAVDTRLPPDGMDGFVSRAIARPEFGQETERRRIFESFIASEDTMCRSLLDIEQNGEIRTASIWIKSNATISEIKACVVDNLYSSMGLDDEGRHLRMTMGDLFPLRSDKVFSPTDLLLLKTLYIEEIHVGMTADEAAVAVESVITRNCRVVN